MLLALVAGVDLLQVVAALGARATSRAAWITGSNNAITAPVLPGELMLGIGMTIKSVAPWPVDGEQTRGGKWKTATSPASRIRGGWCRRLFTSTGNTANDALLSGREYDWQIGFGNHGPFTLLHGGRSQPERPGALQTWVGLGSNHQRTVILSRVEHEWIGPQQPRSLGRRFE